MMSSINRLVLFGAIINLFSLLKLLHSIPVQEKHQPQSLILVHVLFRHGDRTPDKLEIYPKDPYANNSYYPIGYGELTNDGKRREYLLGKALRKRYNNFLGIYSPDVLLARTTDYNRTKVSCQLVLAGLYPPGSEQRWDAFLNWQPIPYHYETINRDHLLADPRSNCPQYIKYYNDYLSVNGLILYNKNKHFYEYISKHTGLDVQTPKSIYELYFLLKSQDTMGFKLPAWTKSVWPTNITAGAVEEYYVGTATDRMRRLSGGFLLKKIVEDTKLKIQGKLAKNRKVFLYSAHENNIAYLLLLLDVFYPHVPPFGAYLTIEVHKIRGIYGFKFIYQDYSEELSPKVLKVPGCEIFCPIDTFIELVEKYFPTSEDVCGKEEDY